MSSSLTVVYPTVQWLDHAYTQDIEEIMLDTPPHTNFMPTTPSYRHMYTTPSYRHAYIHKNFVLASTRLNVVSDQSKIDAQDVVFN